MYNLFRMLPINNLNVIAAEEEERLEEIRLENTERRIMRDQSDCFLIDDIRFVDLFRITKDMAQYLLNGIMPAITRGNFAMRPDTKFFGALHFFATGSYQRIIGRSYNVSMSQQSMSKVIEEVSNAIINAFGGTWVQFPQTEQRKLEIKTRFMREKNFPGIIGVVDATHIEIIRPVDEEHAFLNRKGFHSKNIQIVNIHTLINYSITNCFCFRYVIMI